MKTKHIRWEVVWMALWLALWLLSLLVAWLLASHRGEVRGRREGMAVYQLQLRVDREEARFLERTGWPRVRLPERSTK